MLTAVVVVSGAGLLVVRDGGTETGVRRQQPDQPLLQDCQGRVQCEYLPVAKHRSLGTDGDSVGHLGMGKETRGFVQRKT